MDTTIFYKIVRKHFNYLVTDFGFISDEIDGNQDYGAVKFVSPKSIILVEADRDQLGVRIKPADYPTGIYIDLNWIIEYLTNKTATDLPRVSFPITESQIDYVLQVYARLLKTYCHNFLNGDFSRWKDLIMYVIEEMKVNYRAATGMELPSEAYQRLKDYIDK